MPLTLFTDTYAELSDVDVRLNKFCEWTELDTAAKEARISAASFMIDDLQFWGSKDDPGQAMEFPRAFDAEFADYLESGDNMFILEGQTKRLRAAVVHQLIYEFNSSGPGLVNYGIGDESQTTRQEVLCREARSEIWRYWKG